MPPAIDPTPAMVHAFARLWAVLKMNVEDYYPNHKRWWVRLHEKGGKFHEMPCHHNAEAYLNAYFQAAGIAGEKGTPLFRALDRKRQLTAERLHRNDAWEMIKRQARKVGLNTRVCAHTFRATGLTEYMRNGGTLEKAQQMANHASSKTTSIFIHLDDEVTLDEVERVVI